MTDDVVGGYLLLTRVTVSSSSWRFYGYNAFGLSLVPLLAGIGALFFNGRSVIGWVLTGGGALIIFAGIISNRGIYFQPSSLFDTLLILALIAGGIGVIARSLRASASSSTRPVGPSRVRPMMLGRTRVVRWPHVSRHVPARAPG